MSLLDVIRLNGHVYFGLSAIVERQKNILKVLNSGRKQPQPLDDNTRDSLVKDFSNAMRMCQKVELNVSASSIEYLLERAESGELHIDEAVRAVQEVQNSMIHELKSMVLFYIPTMNAHHYTDPRKKWERVIERFPDTVTDIEEAWKCYALARYTAAVFHSLQVAEAGLVEFGKFINVTDPISGWTAVAQRLKKIIDTKHQDRSDFEKENAAFLEQIHGTIEALKNAWRNKVSHVHGRLILMSGEEFHPDVAEEILLATRALMRRLAEGLPPKAV